MSSANYFVEVVSVGPSRVELALSLAHAGIVDVGSDRLFGWRLLAELKGLDAFGDDARDRARAEIAAVHLDPVKNARETSRDARAVFVDPASWVDEDTLPVFGYTIEVHDAAALEGVSVGATCDSFAYPEDGDPI
jgi:hypothetical protein